MADGVQATRARAIYDDGPDQWLAHLQAERGRFKTKLAIATISVMEGRVLVAFQDVFFSFQEILHCIRATIKMGVIGSLQVALLGAQRRG